MLKEKNKQTRVLIRMLTFCPCLNVISLHYFTDTLISFCHDVITVFSAMIHVGVPVFRLCTDIAKFLPTIPANLLALQDVARDRRASTVFGNPPFEVNAR